MLDWEGNMQQKRDRQHLIILDDVEDDVNMVASLQITPLTTFLVHLDPYPTLLWIKI